MKKLFLIPLLALCSCVMAWADNVARIGETEYATVAAAIADAENGATITLLANTGGDVTLSKDITLNGDKKFTGNITIGASEVTLTLAGVTIDVTGNDAIVHVGKTLNVIVAEGTTNAVYAKSNGCDCFYGTSNGHLNISGNGTLDVYGLEALHVSYMNLSAPNATYGASKTLMYEPHIVSATISAGTFDREFPDSYVTAPLFIEKVSSSYVVSNIGANKAVYNYAAYASLQAAVDAAAVGATIVMYADDAAAVTVDKPLTIVKNGHSINTNAGSGIALKEETGSSISYIYQSLKDFVDFLTAEGINSLVVTEDLDISNAGAIHVSGNKTLTINSGVTVTYKRQGSLANIVVDNGAKLTILGSGTFTPVMHSETRTIEGFTAEISSSASNQIGNRVIDVDGELVVGVKNDADNCPHFITSSLARGSAVMVNATGVATFNNADMQVAMMSIKNYGTVTIHGGEYKSISTCKNGINESSWWAYHLNNEGIMTVNGGHFVGVQGAFSNANATAIVTINGGSFETVYGHNWATGVANNKTDNTKDPNYVDNHYALYVACYSVVNVYGGYYKVQTPSRGSNRVIEIGNNDAYNTYGVVNLYGGNFQQKATVSARKNKDSSYPASIPSTSQWYGCFGSEAPLPAGYEYYETGDATYPYGVRAIAGKEADAIDPAQQAAQEADPEYTIPWQQATTWASDAVPEENTIVTIPVDATVTVSNAEATKTAVADQVYVSQGATLKVETGTTLNIGEGGMNIGNGGQIVVEPGAVVTVGDAGIITTEDEALVIEATEEDQGVLLLNPAVTENTQPKATVKLVAKAKQVGENEFIWERFAIPTIDGASTVFNAESLDTVTFYNGASSFAQGLYEWSDASQDWEGVSNWHNLKPFKGYQLTNNSKYGNVVYTFEGNLAGNVGQNFQFAQSGFGFFGNSYTGDIDIQKFMDSFGGDMQRTIWIYDYYTDQFKAVTEASYGSVYYGKRNDRHGAITDVRSMQAFLMNTFAEGESQTAVNYAAAIWGNPKYGLVSTPTPAPKRAAVNNADKVTIYVAGEKQEDEVTFIRSNEYSAAFDNGADASKWMNKGLNLYVITNDEELSSVASDEIVDMTIAFQSGNETEYTLGFDNLSGEEFSIRDILTGAVVRMTEGATYTFTQEANTTIPARFQILGIRKIMTGVENAEGATVQQKVVKNGNLYILRDNKWYSAQGQLVKE